MSGKNALQSVPQRAEIFDSEEFGEEAGPVLCLNSPMRDAVLVELAVGDDAEFVAIFFEEFFAVDGGVVLGGHGVFRASWESGVSIGTIYFSLRGPKILRTYPRFIS